MASWKLERTPYGRTASAEAKTRFILSAQLRTSKINFERIHLDNSDYSAQVVQVNGRADRIYFIGRAVCLVFELENSMARKPATRARFTLFDVFYEDGSQRSRRRVPSDDVEGQDGEARIRAFIEQQDREIAEKSGIAPLGIRLIRRAAGT
jgi:hypothetical protein